jgi:hypothetical protein
MSLHKALAGLSQTFAERPAESQTDSRILDQQLVKIGSVQHPKVGIGLSPRRRRTTFTCQEGHLAKEITYLQMSENLPFVLSVRDNPDLA